MKKIFTLFAAVAVAACAMAGSYGILVNGTTYTQVNLPVSSRVFNSIWLTCR